jgi:hypothetical protein
VHACSTPRQGKLTRKVPMPSCLGTSTVQSLADISVGNELAVVRSAARSRMLQKQRPCLLLDGIRPPVVCFPSIDGLLAARLFSRLLS